MESIRFTTDDGLSLQAELRLPEGPPKAGAVLCHPHPRQGGSKDHPLLWAIRNDLAHRGFAVVVFNFRGVMGSEGTYDGGVGEVRDAAAALDFIGRHAPEPTFLAGWSFGASVALRVAVDDPRVGALALLGFPLSESSLVLPDPPPREVLKAYDRPVLLVAGEADPFCPVPDLKGLGRRLARSTVVVVKGTDHFFGRREREGAEIVGAFAQRELLGGRPLA